MNPLRFSLQSVRRENLASAKKIAQTAMLETVAVITIATRFVGVFSLCLAYWIMGLACRRINKDFLRLWIFL